NDIQLMSNAVYGEARGEPYEGQVAVAAVILNRVESATFPNTVSEDIFELRAFTAVSFGVNHICTSATAVNDIDSKITPNTVFGKVALSTLFKITAATATCPS